MFNINLNKFGVGHGSVFDSAQHIIYEGKHIAKISKDGIETLDKRFHTLPFFVKLQYKRFKRKMGI